MQSRLIVKNFGPIDFVDLDLRNVNVFIGPQASGKSALAKLFTIFKAPRKFLSNPYDGSNVIDFYKAFLEVLEEYNIASFLKFNTEIQFESELHSLNYYSSGLIIYEPKLFIKIGIIDDLKNNFEANKNLIKQKIIALRSVLEISYLEIIRVLGDFEEDENPMDVDTIDHRLFINLNEEKVSEIINVLRKVETNLSTIGVLYIPSDRNFSNIIKNSALNLLKNNAPIPKHLLSFGAELEKATIKEIDLRFLHENLIYKSIDGQDRIFTGNKNIKLSEAASGVQSVLPILLPIFSHDPDSLQCSFVIEEPELNLFPDAQYKLIKLLSTRRQSSLDGKARTIHIYTTHSPYILSALNNLLYADKVRNRINPKIKRGHSKSGNIVIQPPVKEPYPLNEFDSSVIEPDHFTAYQIKEGKAEDIFDRGIGLIKDNYIDEASDKMTDDFDALMELMK